MSVALPVYAELHCLSNFTFLRGASHPEELVERAAQLGYRALALTDECSLAGVVRAHVAAKKCGLQLIIGTELQLPTVRIEERGARVEEKRKGILNPQSSILNPQPSKLILLATDRNSYGDLSQLITTARRRAAKGAYRLEWSDLERGLEGCLALFVASAASCPSSAQSWSLYAQRLHELFRGRLWIAAELLQGPDDRAQLDELYELASTCNLPLTAAGDVHMHVRSRRPLQDALTAIRLGKTLSAARAALYPNAERHLRMRARLAQIYPPQLLAAAARIAERCDFSLDCLRYEYPDEIVPAGHTASTYLRALTEEGVRIRFTAGEPRHVRDLIEHELALIAELRYEPYFLTVYDIVRFARSRGILCQGRGSAANSVVCYCLGITEVDPARMNVLFERFISRERNEPPDIDVDFEHERREDVIQYLYHKDGRDRAAIAATVITYRAKSALRDVGKALGFDLAQVDRLAQSFAGWDGWRPGRGPSPDRRLAEAGFALASPQIAQLIALVDILIGFPRHLSQHVGGFVISRGPVSRLVPVENAAMAERTVIEWDKDDLDALGLLKVDVLALGMLSALRRALDMLSARRGKPFTMSDIPAEHPGVYEMIQHADTVGVFQIESRAQMAMLPRLRPACFYDLVIEVAIVRPGPLQGGMVHPYLRRRQGLEEVVYPSPAVKHVLSRTLGVPIFQEQVMQLAMVAAGFSPGEADGLRRSMAAWHRKGGIERFEQRLINGMLERGYSREFANQIFQQILGFGEYGFPESHSASFALLAYASAWIKRHEPAVFLVALLNSQPMGFYAPAQLVQDARRHGVEVKPVDVMVSEWDCTLEDARIEDRGLRIEKPTHPPTPHPSTAVRLGLRLVSGLAESAVQRLVAARKERAFVSIDDMARRAELNRRDPRQLAAAGALQTLAGHRRNAHWLVAGIEHPPALLADAPIVEEMPKLASPSEADNMVADYASVGFTLGRHPLALLRQRLRNLRFSTAQEVHDCPQGRPVRAAGIVIGRQRPDTASGVVFVTLEDETGCVNVIVWRDLGEKQRRELLGSKLMGVYGVLERQGEVVHLVAKRLIDHTALLGRLATKSRDFH